MGEWMRREEKGPWAIPGAWAVGACGAGSGVRGWTLLGMQQGRKG